MTNDPNIPPSGQPPQHPERPQHHDPYWNQQPQYGGQPQQYFSAEYPHQGSQHQQPAFSGQGFGTPPPPYGHQVDPKRPKGPFGASFWIVGGLLALIVLSNAISGRGESILIFLGIAALLSGLYSLIFKRRSWAALPGRKAATAVAIAGAASLVIGGIAAAVDSSRGAGTLVASVTSAELEADAAARLATREQAVKKAEEAVKTREAAVGSAEVTAASTTVKEGVWTVGKDIVPGNYRTTKEVVGDCSWKITRTGSNGEDYIAYDYFVEGGFPMVSLVEGQTFESDGCGEWTKQ